MKTSGHVLPGKLLVKQDDGLEKTPGGIYIPDTINEKPKRGEVIITGPSTDRHPMHIEVGDIVFWPDHAGTEYTLEEKELSLDGPYVLLDQGQVLFIKKTQ